MIERTTRLLLSNAAAVVDHAVNFATFSGAARQTGEQAFAHEERLRLLGVLAKEYETEAAKGYFRAARSIAPIERPVRELSDGGWSVDLTWPSDYQTFLPEMQGPYNLTVENRTAGARFFRHRTPAPLAILVHGYLGGDYRVEQRVWPVDWLYRIGLDVALFVLPYHGVRGPNRRFRELPIFPGADPRVTNEGFRQAMGDLTDLTAWILGRGHPSVGIMGMSLGGYTTALFATVESKLSFAVPIIPLASVADSARDQGRLGSSPTEIESQHRALDAAHRIISPLHRAAVIPSRSILVVGAESDQITPISHARRLAIHFRARLETWHGGHLLQVGRAEKFREIGRLLNELGIIRRDI